MISSDTLVRSIAPCRLAFPADMEPVALLRCPRPSRSHPLVDTHDAADYVMSVPDTVRQMRRVVKQRQLDRQRHRNDRRLTDD